jgi:hypothetical protein
MDRHRNKNWASPRDRAAMSDCPPLASVNAAVALGFARTGSGRITCVMVVAVPTSQGSVHQIGMELEFWTLEGGKRPF